MSINFNNIPNTVRTPGTYIEIDNSRALKGLLANPHRALIIGQKHSDGNAGIETLYAITSDGLANGYFGAGSIAARMCNTFKKNNPNTELYAIAISNPNAATAASARIHFSYCISHAGGSCSAGDQYVRLMAGGKKLYLNLTSGWSVININSGFKTLINAAANSDLPFTASIASLAASNVLILSAINSGTLGNYIDVRFNHYDGESHPTFFGSEPLVSVFEGGAGDPDLANVWAVVDNLQFHHIINPYINASNLTDFENHLADAWKPLTNKPGLGYTGLRAAAASCTTLGNTRNSPYNTIIGAYNSPTCPEEWAAAVGAVAAYNLNNDPARPIQFLQLKGITAPKQADRFTQSERDVLLYDGIATWICDVSGNVLIERLITTFQTNALGIPDYSYLDIETLATLMEIRYQFEARMTNRYIIPRYKLADNTFQVTPGNYVVTPNTIKQEIISLFTSLQEKGLIENLSDFIANIIVERDASDVNRVNVLLPDDLINQFRVLAGTIQFIL